MPSVAAWFLLLLGAAVTAARAPQPPGAGFAARVRPILEARCMPCHFEGGKMYAQLPFDREETIRKLGESLFTRIKDEEERAAIRAFLATAP